jgi:hypothetical protein
MKEYNKELCDERHRNLDHTIACIQKKFNQILLGIVLTLISVIGSLIATIVTRH